MVQVEECTPGKDAVCESCPHGEYITNDDTCQPCGDICEGKECTNCNITPTPTPSEKSTPAGITGLSTASQTSMITFTSLPNIDKQGSSWKSIYLLPIIGAPANGDSEQQSFVNPNVSSKKQDDEKTVNLAVKQKSTEDPIGCSDDLIVSYKREVERTQMGHNPSSTDQFGKDEYDMPARRTEIPEQNVLMNPNGIQPTNESSSKGVKKVMRGRSSTSSLPDVSEGTPLSCDLPEWCKHDITMVGCEDISDISRHIGKEVTRIGGILGLTTGEVETIKHDHKFDISRQNLVVLQEWKRMKGVHATKGVLARALESIGKTEIAIKYLWPEQEWDQGTEILDPTQLMNTNGSSIHQTNGSSSKGVKKVRRRRSSTSSLPDVSEDAPLSGDLPEWCKHDNTMVKCEDISDISRHIGKEVTRIGVILGLTTGEVETIEHDHKFDISRQNLVVLQEWKRMKGVHATKGVLAHALYKIGRGELAKKYLWPEQEWDQGILITTTFWGTRKSQELEINDSGYFRNKDWTVQRTWQGIWNIMLENNFGSFRQLKLACGTVELQQPHLKCIQRCPLFQTSIHGLDRNALGLSPIYYSSFKYLFPVSVSHGVNCLFSAASVIYYGSEDNFLELKIRTVVELAYHKDYYLNQETLINCMEAEYALTKLEEKDTSFKSTDIEARFENLVRKTLIKQNVFSLQGNSMHLFGLASVFNCNIQSVYPTIGASQPSPLNVLITPRKKIENPATVFIMWSRHTPKAEYEHFIPNHFVPLFP
ncbi:uncharacterized protein [Antedon mediterranea]|uniref:uncharacterized protein n=1 Tax=Antedon mediterranea TaxID=105859 RepID=UPI003AF83D80